MWTLSKGYSFDLPISFFLLIFQKEGVALTAKLETVISESPSQLLTISNWTTAQVSSQKSRKLSRMCFRDLILYYCAFFS